MESQKAETMKLTQNGMKVYEIFPTKVFNKIIAKRDGLVEDFVRLCFEIGKFNKFNKTYTLELDEITPYGFAGKIRCPIGLSFTGLTDHVGIIQENLRCIWIMTIEQFKETATVQIVTTPLDKNYRYQNPFAKPYELYIGVDFCYKPIKINLNEHCMVLIAGGVGSGKTRLIYQTLTSFIINNKVNEVELYIADIAKNEFNMFQHCKHVRAYSCELEHLYKVALFLKDKITKRKESISKLREAGIATNIVEYNEYKAKRGESTLSYVMWIIDELSILNPDNTDTKEEKEMKMTTLDVLKQASKLGRGLGIFTILATQKCTKDEIPAILRNMSAVRISMRANDAVSSQVIMEDSSAVGLAERYGVYSLNGGSHKDYLFSAMFTTDMLTTLLQPHIDKEFHKVDLRGYLTPSEIEDRRRGQENAPVYRQYHGNKAKSPYNVINLNPGPDSGETKVEREYK